jgi:hypothetical protein
MSILQLMHRSVSSWRSLLRQARASLLLAVFLSAGTSLPGLDALVYHHSATEADRSQSHVEPAGGCLDHGQHCTLGRTAGGSGTAPTPSTEVTVQPVSPPDQPLTTQSLLSVDPTGIPNCRAPPVLLA